VTTVKYVVGPPGGDRVHHVNPDDVRIVLSRLPPEVCSRLRCVHFKDRSRGGRVHGYVTTRGRREITLCSLPRRISFTKSALHDGDSPEDFGARGTAWPTEAVRRYMLYSVFLHELGHLQEVRPDLPDPRRRYADERMAGEFAAYWRGVLWSQRFDHPDPVHNPPSA
jgi:hypothetical protein